MGLFCSANLILLARGRCALPVSGVALAGRKATAQLGIISYNGRGSEWKGGEILYALVRIFGALPFAGRVDGEVAHLTNGLAWYVDAHTTRNKFTRLWICKLLGHSIY